MTGAEQFKDWRTRRGFNQQEAADYLGWDFTFVSKIETGRRSLGVKNAVHLEKHSGIPVEAWVSSDVDTESLKVSVARRKPR